MDNLFWFATLVGWPFTLFFVFFGGDVDADFDADIDADFEFDADAGGGDAALDVAGGGGLLSAVLSFLSFRSLVFFASFFGLTGVVLGALGTSAPVRLGAAIGMGAFSMWFNRLLMRYLKRTDSDSTIRDRNIAGLPARVVLPIGPETRGRVAVEVHGQQILYTASLFSPSDQHRFDVGDTVVVVEVANGAAKVAALGIPG